MIHLAAAVISTNIQSFTFPFQQIHAEFQSVYPSWQVLTLLPNENIMSPSMCYLFVPSTLNIAASVASSCATLHIGCVIYVTGLDFKWFDICYRKRARRKKSEYMSNICHNNVNKLYNPTDSPVMGNSIVAMLIIRMTLPTPGVSITARKGLSIPSSVWISITCC